jgi:hypothetical protein
MVLMATMRFDGKSTSALISLSRVLGNNIWRHAVIWGKKRLFSNDGSPKNLGKILGMASAFYIWKTPGHGRRYQETGLSASNSACPHPRSHCGDKRVATWY